jgi:hypothetical protein
LEPPDILGEMNETNSPFNYVSGQFLNMIDPTGMGEETLTLSSGLSSESISRFAFSSYSFGENDPKTKRVEITQNPMAMADLPTLKAYNPDIADRWREGNLGQQFAYGLVDGINSLFSNSHLGGAQFRNYDDKINTRVFGLLTLAGPISNIGKEIQVGKNLLGNTRIPVYRVFGNISKQNGFSWTFINPKLFTSSFFKKIAGLPNVNSATSIVKGSTKIKDIKLFRRALPLDGNPGGLPELIIEPKNVRMKVPSDYKSYFKF